MSLFLIQLLFDYCSLFLYHQENKNKALFVFPCHKVMMLNLYDLSETLFCMNSWLGGVKPSWLHYVSGLIVLIFLPSSYDLCMVRTVTPPLSFGKHDGLFILSPEHFFIITQNHCRMDL